MGPARLRKSVGLRLTQAGCRGLMSKAALLVHIARPSVPGLGHLRGL